MGQKLTDDQHLTAAWKLARSANCFLVEKPCADKTEYVLYRRAEPRNTRIGKRSSAAAIHTLAAHVAAHR